uniref:Olfactory receptor 95 n=1 Tax=Meteorus pulchricornis TaxID=51522 RepID=A0A1S5VFT6_9HYME|nr:olfactory receptor 95 [Meteorus pulchricornis]
MWESTRSDNNITAKMARAAKYSKTLTKYYTIGVCFMCSLYIIYPYSVTSTAYFHKEFNSSIEYSANVFPFDIPYKINSFFIFVISVTFQQIGAIAVCVIWASCDTLFAQLTCHVNIQFTVIANELKVIINNYRDLNDHRTAETKLTNIVNRYEELFMCCYSIQMFFNPIIFFTIISNGISLCACAYRLNDNVINARWGELPKQTLALLSTSVQTMIYCTFAEALTESSGAVKDGVYNSHWIHCNRKLKKALIIIMIRAQKEFKYTAYSMIDINYNQLTQIFNGAMSYFMLLRNLS